MNKNFEKFGLAAVMVAAFITGIFTEGASRESSTVFFSLAMISFGILVVMVAVDWWRGRDDDDSTDEPKGGLREDRDKGK